MVRTFLQCHWYNRESRKCRLGWARCLYYVAVFGFVTQDSLRSSMFQPKQGIVDLHLDANDVPKFLLIFPTKFFHFTILGKDYLSA